MPYEPAHSFINFPLADASAEGSRVAVLQTANTPSGPDRPVDYFQLVTQVWVVHGDGSPAKHLTTLWGASPFGEGDDYEVQWSPQGATFATSLAIWHGPATGFRTTVVLFDADRGQETGRLEGMSLAGSASWSPDGSRLLVTTQECQRVCSVDVVSGQLHPVAALPAPRPLLERPGSPRIVGHADDDELLVLLRRGNTMTLHRTDGDGNDIGALMRWTGSEYTGPNVCRMPPGYWASVS